jgi:hypothetical protein
VRGSEGALVSAAGDLRAHHVERARLESGGVMELNDAVNSELSAVEIRIGRSLRGGRAAVERGLVTRDAGTPSGTTPTIIEAGVPRQEAQADARSVLTAAKASRMAARRQPASRGPHAGGAASGKLARELIEATRGILARKIHHAERMAALGPTAFIEVRGAAYAGVEVRIGDARLQLDDTVRRVRFTLDVQHRTIRAEGIGK